MVRCTRYNIMSVTIFSNIYSTIVHFSLGFATDQWFFLCISVSSTDNTDRHYITEILLKVALNTITLILTHTGIPGADSGGGGRTRRAGASPLKLEKYAFSWRKIVIFHMKYPKNFAPPPP